MCHDEGELHINQLPIIDYIYTRGHPLLLCKGFELFAGIDAPWA